jgi:hypothetical protein
MYCHNCGAPLIEQAKFCTVCGTVTQVASQAAAQAAAHRPAAVPYPQTAMMTGGIGYSNRINDPAFARYIKQSNRFAAGLMMLLALAAVVGFYIYGETDSGLGNPQALLIGLALGGLFALTAMIQMFRHKKSTTWDGKVVDKQVANKRRRERVNSDADYQYVTYTEYTLVIEDQRGKKHRLINENNSTAYDYFQVGDQVRHHAGLNTYEKYDKSRDRTIPCNACGTLNFVENENCSRCKCPLLSTDQ